MPRPRAVILVTSAIEVHCPYCGEPQPDPDGGSHIWTVQQVDDTDGQRRPCVACAATILILRQNQVRVAR